MNILTHFFVRCKSFYEKTGTIFARIFCAIFMGAPPSFSQFLSAEDKLLTFAEIIS
jgi:hypothetical protein